MERPFPETAKTPKGQAQDLVDRAWEAKGLQKVELARKALELWPDCADAWVVLAVHASSPEEKHRLLVSAVAAGERALGLPERRRAWAGQFWGAIETRPYMRARLALARHWESQGNWKTAAVHDRELLTLNPNDDPGVRYLLLPLLLRLSREDEAERLLERFDDDSGADWAYHRAFLAWHRTGDSSVARALLRRALVPGYRFGHSPFRRNCPKSPAAGTKRRPSALPLGQRRPPVAAGRSGRWVRGGR